MARKLQQESFVWVFCVRQYPGGQPVSLQRYVSYHVNIFLLFNHFQSESWNEVAKAFHLFLPYSTTLRGHAIGSRSSI